jgi:SAM-dependent methyltransferase
MSKNQSIIAQEKEEWDEIAVGMSASEFEKDSRDGYLDTLLPLMKNRLESALNALADVRRKQILVCGCGKGIETIQLLMRGAYVSTFDLSSGMCRLTHRRVHKILPELPDAKLSLVQSTFEQLPFPTAYFDGAIGVDILHHLEDIAGSRQELQRVLRVGSKAVFIEPWAGNPVLMFARKHIPGHFGIPCWGSTNESPLDGSRAAEFSKGWQEPRLYFPVVMLFLKIVDNPIMGLVLKRGKRGDTLERFLLWIIGSSQFMDQWLSSWLPQSIRRRLSYVCQIELVRGL